MTVFIQTHLYKRPDVKVIAATPWMPWINVDDVKQTVALAAHRCARESGLKNARSALKTFEIHVCYYTEEHHRLHPSGRPATCDYTRFQFKRSDS